MTESLRLVPDPHPTTFAVGEVVAALSHALDLTEGQPPGHARRSCLIALRLADALALPAADRREPLLRDAAQGCRLLVIVGAR